MKSDAKASVLKVLIKMTELLKDSAHSVDEDKPIGAINKLLELSEASEKLAAAMIRIESMDSGKSVPEICGCESCKLIVKEQKERDERKATSPLN